MSKLKERIKIPETDNKPDKELVKQVEAQVTAGFKELFKKYRFLMHNLQLLG